MPRVPPAATAPAASFRSYPKRAISGRATRPMVNAEATEEPESAANPVQPSTVPCASPPRIQPTQALAAL